MIAHMMKYIRAIVAFFIFCAMVWAQFDSDPRDSIPCNNNNDVKVIAKKDIILDFSANVDPRYIAMAGSIDKFTQETDEFFAYVVTDQKLGPYIKFSPESRHMMSKILLTNSKVPIFTRNPNIGMLCKLGTSRYWNRTYITFGQDRFSQCQF